jgi:hypothetical protein
MERVKGEGQRVKGRKVIRRQSAGHRAVKASCVAISIFVTLQPNEVLCNKGKMEKGEKGKAEELMKK